MYPEALSSEKKESTSHPHQQDFFDPSSIFLSKFESMSQNNAIVRYDSSGNQMTTYSPNAWAEPLRVSIEDAARGVKFQYSGPPDSRHSDTAMKIASKIAKQTLI